MKSVKFWIAIKNLTPKLMRLINSNFIVKWIFNVKSIIKPNMNDLTRDPNRCLGSLFAITLSIFFFKYPLPKKGLKNYILNGFSLFFLGRPI